MIKEIKEKTASLSALIDTAEYEVYLDSQIAPSEEFQANLNKMLENEHIRIERRIKGRNKELDIRPYIDSIELRDEKLHIRTRKIENRTVRIAEILNLLIGTASGIDVHRTKQLIKQGTVDYTPFDILS